MRYASNTDVSCDRSELEIKRIVQRYGAWEFVSAWRADRALIGFKFHSVEYVKGDVHTNGLENFWSLFKRTVKGTYVAIAPFHVGRYVSEQSFRFNNRLKSDFGRFFQALSQVVGKRLTYRTLAAIGDAGFMGIE